MSWNRANWYASAWWGPRWFGPSRVTKKAGGSSGAKFHPVEDAPRKHVHVVRSAVAQARREETTSAKASREQMRRVVQGLQDAMRAYEANAQLRQIQAEQLVSRVQPSVQVEPGPYEGVDFRKLAQESAIAAIRAREKADQARARLTEIDVVYVTAFLAEV